MDAAEAVALVDYRRRVFALYAEVRSDPDPRRAWTRWRAGRDALLREHPCSPLPAQRRSSFTGCDFYPYDPAWRLTARIRPAPGPRLELTGSTGETFTFSRVGILDASGAFEPKLELYWLETYGGGLFLPLRDGTSGRTTYGGGRYLLDTVKGADLGTTADGRLVLDLNFSYQPSCAYDARWACPLAPPANHLDIAVEAGERYGG